MKKALFVLLAATAAFEVSASSRCVRLLRPFTSISMMKPIIAHVPQVAANQITTAGFTSQAKKAINPINRTSSNVLLTAMITKGNLAAFSTQTEKKPAKSIVVRRFDLQLWKAIESNNIQEVKQAITNGAHIHIKNQYGQTPLHMAARFTHTDIPQTLVAAGADVNAQDYSGNTPLHIAAKYNNTNAAKALIDAGADLETQEFWRETPLHTAVLFGHANTVKVLIDAGANLNVGNKENKTPLDLARDRLISYKESYKDIVKLLNSTFLDRL